MKVIMWMQKELETGRITGIYLIYKSRIANREAFTERLSGPRTAVIIMNSFNYLIISTGLLNIRHELMRG